MILCFKFNYTKKGVCNMRVNQENTLALSIDIQEKLVPVMEDHKP